MALVDKLAARLSTYPPSEWDDLKVIAKKWIGEQGFVLKEDFEDLWLDAQVKAGELSIVRAIPKKLSEIASVRIKDRELEKEAPSTGYAQLDRLIKGFVPGHLYSVTGHTNVGKTSVSANFAYNVSSQGKKVLYFSLEPAETLVEYLASVRLIKPFSDITTEELTEEIPNIDVFTKEQVDTIDDVLMFLRKLPRYDLVIIDHLGYFTRNSQNVNQDQANVVKQLVQVAKEKRTAIIQIVHVNKSATDIPNMKNISGSAAIYQDSTEVLIVMRNVDETTVDSIQKKYLDTGFILVEKTKSGPTGAVPISFMPMSAYITDNTPRCNREERDVYKLLT